VSLDEQIAETAQAVVPFAREFELFAAAESRRRAKAEAIATFACLCAPADPSPGGLLVAARLLAIILCLDDLSKDRLNQVTEEMFEVLRVPGGAPAEPQARALAAYLHELDGYGDTSFFRRQFEQCLLAVREETRLLAAGPLTIESYQDIRPRLIFVEEYIWTWLISERMPFDADSVERTGRLRRLASDVAYLVNDLGSVDKDRAPDCDPNLVFLIARDRGISEEQAILMVVRWHDETANAYRAELKDLRAPGATPAVLAIADVVDFTVRGNLATTRKLSKVRYPGAEERLAQLAEY
jgi:hypothetical protein